MMRKKNAEENEMFMMSGAASFFAMHKSAANKIELY